MMLGRFSGRWVAVGMGRCGLPLKTRECLLRTLDVTPATIGDRLSRRHVHAALVASLGYRTSSFSQFDFRR